MESLTNMLPKFRPFERRLLFLCHYAGACQAEEQSRNHGSPVTKDQCGERGEDHAI